PRKQLSGQKGHRSCPGSMGTGRPYHIGADHFKQADKRHDLCTSCNPDKKKELPHSLMCIKCDSSHSFLIVSFFYSAIPSLAFSTSAIADFLIGILQFLL